MENETFEDRSIEELTELKPEESSTVNVDDEDTYPPFYMDVF
jgi:hypothetical protein